MKNVFLDTNILIDLLADRKPFSKFAVQIFHLSEKKTIKLFASSHSIATTYYILNKHIDDSSLRNIIDGLLNYVAIVSVDNDIIKKSLQSKHKDFEDAIQILCAHSVNNLHCIITRNIKDFKHSNLLVVSPDEFCLKFTKKYN